MIWVVLPFSWEKSGCLSSRDKICTGKWWANIIHTPPSHQSSVNTIEVVFLQEKALKTQDWGNLNLMFFNPSNSPLLQHLIPSSASVPVGCPVLSLVVGIRRPRYGVPDTEIPLPLLFYPEMLTRSLACVLSLAECSYVCQSCHHSLLTQLKTSEWILPTSFCSSNPPCSQFSRFLFIMAFPSVSCLALSSHLFPSAHSKPFPLHSVAEHSHAHRDLESTRTAPHVSYFLAE